MIAQPNTTPPTPARVGGAEKTVLPQGSMGARQKPFRVSHHRASARGRAAIGMNPGSNR